MFKNFQKIYEKNCIQNIFTYLTVKRYAGHSKWQNIRHIKGAKDSEKATLFKKLSRQMRIAIAEGGSADPGSNLKLEHVLEQARRYNMPNATIQSLLKASKEDKSNCKSHIVEIKGPGSAMILCELFTSNVHHAKQQISTVIRKHKYGDGGALHLFQQKGIIITEIPDDVKTKKPEEVLESATDHAVEAGAEDVELADDETLCFTCGSTSLRNVEKALDGFNYKITSSTVEFIAFQLIKLGDDEMGLCARLYEKLEEIPDVVKLSDNIE